MKKSLKLATLLAGALTFSTAANAFCGFFVAKAGAKLFNESSAVILVRDGDQSTITMSNDYQGDVKDFAMVIPVPVVLKEDQIRTVGQIMFDRFDGYSAPRLAEYYDMNPCYEYRKFKAMTEKDGRTSSGSGLESPTKLQEQYGISIEAKYTIGEYDILILSAKESNGLKTWLNLNNYSLPESAEEVLDPYIKSGMKFFVAKVNLEKFEDSGYSLLSPLQISFKSEKFMLPIRLGMANAQGPQDLIVYALTKNGRVETTNYRTVKMPSNVEVPTFLKDPDLFGYFYHDVFATSYRREGKNNVFLEYAWNISGNQWQKCDPCVSEPPMVADLTEAGVSWIKPSGNAYQGDLFFTRLHVRYDRQRFPQDLQFQETPNQELFQCRYVVRNVVQGDIECDGADEYYAGVAQRRINEMKQLQKLTRWNTDRWTSYVEEYDEYLDDAQGYRANGENNLYNDASIVSDNSRLWLSVLLILSGVLLLNEVRRRLLKAT